VTCANTQVLQQWLSLLTAEEDPVRTSVAAALTSREGDLKRAARDALKDFNAKRWMKLGQQLDQRARKLPLGSRVFQHLALERWADAHRLHGTAMRTHREFDLHQLRIGIKRFRYTVGNYALPDFLGTISVPLSTPHERNVTPVLPSRHLPEMPR